MNVAIMGYGTIGSGVAKILADNAALIAKRVGEELVLTKVLDLRDFEGDPVQNLIVHDYKEIAQDESIELVVETMGGVEPAYTFVRAMLENGKHVTTSNKALVADKGAELLEIASEHHVMFRFEASVGGGIPIIRTMLSCLTGDRIEEITGIINGTTNYMMSRMAAEGCAFDDVLKEAQAKGFAEADPTADIEGHDATRKIAILTSLVAETQVDYEDIPVEGISQIDTDDFVYAGALHRVIRLLAVSRRTGDTFSVRVAPFLLAEGHPLYAVDGVMNAVLLVSDMLGESMYYGSGAGSLPTASAVLGDLVEMARHAKTPTGIPWSRDKVALADPAEQVYENFVRLRLDEKAAREAFPVTKVVDAAVSGEIGILTESMSEREFASRTAKFPENAFIKRIRMA